MDREILQIELIKQILTMTKKELEELNLYLNT